jgi:hypothetical protein
VSAGRSKAELAKLAAEINRVNRLIVETAQAGLQHGIECGGMFIEVKKNVPHGEFEDWLKKHCHEIEPRTARLYMYLAKNADEIEKLAAENGNTVADLSIRGAKRLLAPQPTEEQKAAAQVEKDRVKAEREAAKKAKAEAAKAAAKATNPAAILEALAADEVLDNIDADEKAKLLKRQLRHLTPHDIVRLLDEAWLDDDTDSGLKMLNEVITNRLKSPPVEVLKRRKIITPQPQPSA